jgi:hypothetical protein
MKCPNACCGFQESLWSSGKELKDPSLVNKQVEKVVVHRHDRTLIIRHGMYRPLAKSEFSIFSVGLITVLDCGIICGVLDLLDGWMSEPNRFVDCISQVEQTTLLAVSSSTNSI